MRGVAVLFKGNVAETANNKTDKGKRQIA